MMGEGVNHINMSMMVWGGFLFDDGRLRMSSHVNINKMVWGGLFYDQEMENIE